MLVSLKIPVILILATMMTCTAFVVPYYEYHEVKQGQRSLFSNKPQYRGYVDYRNTFHKIQPNAYGNFINTYSKPQKVTRYVDYNKIFNKLQNQRFMDYAKPYSKPQPVTVQPKTPNKSSVRDISDYIRVNSKYDSFDNLGYDTGYDGYPFAKY